MAVATVMVRVMVTVTVGRGSMEVYCTYPRHSQALPYRAAGVQYGAYVGTKAGFTPRPYILGRLVATTVVVAYTVSGTVFVETKGQRVSSNCWGGSQGVPTCVYGGDLVDNICQSR